MFFSHCSFDKAVDNTGTLGLTNSLVFIQAFLSGGEGILGAADSNEEHLVEDGHLSLGIGNSLCKYSYTTTNMVLTFLLKNRSKFRSTYPLTSLLGCVLVLGNDEHPPA